MGCHKSTASQPPEIGHPEVSNTEIPWFRVDLGDEEILGLEQAVRSRRITLGPLAAELEARLASFLGVPHVVLTSSGSAALLAALLACGVAPGDEVVLPGISFIATAHAPLLLGAKIRLVDVLPDRPILDPSGLSAVLSARTRAVIPVHIGGRAVDLDAVNAIIDQIDPTRIIVIEDAAQALGSCDGAGLLGTRGRLGCFSTSITKLVTTGEGGFIATQNDDIANRLRRIRNQGVVSLGENRFETLGFNLRPTDLLCAMGLARLHAVEEHMNALRRIWNFYATALAEIPYLHLIPMDIDAGELPLWVEVLSPQRDQVIAWLAAAGIRAQPYPPALCDAPHLGCPAKLPNARWFASHAMILPCGPDQKTCDLERTIEVLRGFTTRVRAGLEPPPRH